MLSAERRWPVKGVPPAPAGRRSDSPVDPPPLQAAGRRRCRVGCVLSQNRSGSCTRECLHLILTCLFPSKFSKDGGFSTSVLWSSRYSHQDAITKDTGGPPLLKLSAARSRGSEEIKLFRHRNQEPTEPGVDRAGPSPCYYGHARAMKWWDGARLSWHRGFHLLTPKVWITHPCFLLMNGEETQLKNKAERCDI